MLKNKIMAVTIGLLLATTANTQSLRSDTGPAEQPPASFKGSQYVDSKGCVYIRAGSGARVSWIPRVNRSRNVFCSARNKPSLSATQLAAASGQPATRVVKTQPAPKPAVRTVAAPRVQPQKPVVTQPKPQRIVQAPAPVRVAKPAPVKTVRKPVRTTRQAPLVLTPQPAPTRAVVQRPAPRVVPQKVQTQPRKVATQATNTGRYAVRNGPQTVHPSDVIRGAGVATTTVNSAGQLRSVRGFSPSQRRGFRNLAVRDGPQAVHPADVIRASNGGAVAGTPTQFKNGKDPVHNLTVYKSTIGSDVTPRGDAQMEQIWTNTVPRRLVTKTRAREIAVPARTAPQQDIFRVSSKAAKTTPKAAPLKARYVQLGTYGDATNAKKTITFFQKRGQKVSTRAIKRKGKNYRVIFLGPFQSNTQAQNAMTTAKSAGFQDAFYVR